MALLGRIQRVIARQVPVKSVPLRATRPIASITFDDFPTSAWTIGGPLLARHGVRGTYYAAGGLAGTTQNGLDYFTPDQLAALNTAGHEIGCHCFEHTRSSLRSSADLEADSDRNAQFLKPLANGAAPVSFAFPYGDLSLRTKRLYARRFTNVRGVHPGLNAGTLDLAQLCTIGVERDTWDVAKIDDAIARARQSNAWIVFHTHDVSDAPSAYGCTPAMLEHVLSGLAAARIEALPMREALRVATGESP